MVYAQYGKFCEMAKEHNVIFYYVGYFSQQIVAAMADAVKMRVEQAGVTAATRRKLFSSFVEMAQNIIHYSVDSLTPADQSDRELRHGSVCVGIHEDKYFLLCANPIDTNSVERLRARLESLHGMTMDEIKQAYKQFLRDETPDDSKGAGLGFLTMARDSTEPLEFEFIPTADPQVTMFYLKATV